MQMISVTSHAIAAVGYDPTSRRLCIQFAGKSEIYDFCSVPEHIHRGLMAASSKGEYYNDHIRDRYQC